MQLATKKNILSLSLAALPQPPDQGSLKSQRKGFFIFSYLFDFLILLPFLIFICFTNLGDHSVSHVDEMAHIGVIQEMKLSGNWWQPTLYGKPYFHKPPFKLWLSLLFTLIFGESNFSYRFLDALAGAGTVLLTYVFGRHLFHSRIVGILSALLLLGCRAYILDHTVRHAVQDSLLVFLTTLTLYCAWNFLERLSEVPNLAEGRRQHLLHPRQSHFWMVAGGVVMGLAAFTKNVAGYMPLLILGTYLVTSGQGKLVWQKARYAPLVVLGLALLIPALYLLPHCFFNKDACTIMLEHEVFIRATHGYHNVRRMWFYFGRIFRDRAAVAPELLVLAFLFAVYKITRPFLARKNSFQPMVAIDQRRYLFLFLWALVPVFFYTVIPSRLVWYIAPAYPGMSLLIGGMVGSVATFLWSQFLLWQNGERRFGWLLGSSLLLIYSVGAMTYHLGKVGGLILVPGKQILLDTLTDDILRFSSNRSVAENFLGHFLPAHSEISPPQTPLHVIQYQMPTLSRAEKIYFGRVAPFTTQVTTLEDLRESLSLPGSHFLITSATNFVPVVNLRSIVSYRFLPPPTTFQSHPRQSWAVMLNYQNGQDLKHFQPVETVVRFSDLSDDKLLYGWSGTIDLGEENALKTKGNKAAFIVDGDGGLGYLGSKISLNAARLGNASNDISLGTQIFLNNEKVGELPALEGDWKTYEFIIPSGKWMSGKNVFHLVLQYQDGRTIERASEVAGWNWMKIELNQT